MPGQIKDRYAGIRGFSSADFGNSREMPVSWDLAYTVIPASAATVGQSSPGCVDCHILILWRFFFIDYVRPVD